jgi:hypothetical protein
VNKKEAKKTLVICAVPVTLSAAQCGMLKGFKLPITEANRRLRLIFP